MYISRDYINMTPQMLAGLARNAKGQLQAIFLHWTAGNYHQHFKDYHLCIDGDGKVYSTCLNLLEKKSHTWHRNSNSVGIAMDCCYGAQCSRKSDEELDKERNSSVSHRKNNADTFPEEGRQEGNNSLKSPPFSGRGDHEVVGEFQQKYKADWYLYPPTPQQIMSMAYAVAVICYHADLPINASTVMTHAEIAKVDNYDIESDDPEKKWDLLVLPGYQESGGEVIRKFAKQYLAKFIAERDKLTQQLVNSE